MFEYRSPRIRCTRDKDRLLDATNQCSGVPGTILLFALSQAARLSAALVDYFQFSFNGFQEVRPRFFELMPAIGFAAPRHRTTRTLVYPAPGRSSKAALTAQYKVTHGSHRILALFPRYISPVS
jgi:hypothetical protein